MDNIIYISISTFLQKGKLPFCVLLLLCFNSSNGWSQSGDANPFEIRTESVAAESKTEEEKPVSNPLPSPVETETTTNPFEQGDIQRIEGIEQTVPTASPVSAEKSGNPFDISSDSGDFTDKKEKPIDVKKKPAKTKKKEIEVAKEENSGSSNNSGFIFILVVIITVLFAVLLTLFRGYFGKVYQAFINDSQLRSAYREMGSTIILPYIVLYGMFIINASVLLYVVLTKNGISFGDNWISWFYMIIGLLVVFLGKHLMLGFFGSTFPVSKEVKLYNFTIVVFNIMLGVIFVPLVLIYAYGPDNLLIVLSYLLACIMVILYVYRSIRALLIGGTYLSTHKFHFFMYLCTAEIAPLLLLVKFISKNIH